MPRRPITDETDTENELDQERGKSGDSDNVDTDAISTAFKGEELTGGRVKILRRGKNDLKHAHCGEMIPENFSIESVRQAFGGGDYIARGMRANGTQFKQVSFVIDHRIKGDLDNPPGNQSNNGSEVIALVEKLVAVGVIQKPGTQDRNPDSELLPLMMKQMQESNQNMIAMITQQSQQSMQMFMGMLTTLVPLLSGKAGDKSERKDDTGSLTALMMPVFTKMLERGTQPVPAISLKDQLDALLTLKELAESDEPHEKSGIEKLVALAGPVLMTLMGGGGMQGIPQPMPQIDTSAPPQPLPATQSGNPNPEPLQPVPGANGEVPIQVVHHPRSPGLDPAIEPINTDDMTLKIKMFLELLINAAANDADPVVYFELIQDQLTEKQYDDLVDSIRGDDWQIRLGLTDPRVEPLLPWFEKLRQGMLTDGESFPEPSEESE